MLLTVNHILHAFGAVSTHKVQPIAGCGISGSGNLISIDGTRRPAAYLVSVAGDNTKNNPQTETIVFVACPLLSPMDEQGIPHVYEHDVESFFWVAIWVVLLRQWAIGARRPTRRWDTVDRGA